MRKKTGIAAAIIVLLLLSFWGWLQYRQYSCWNIPVHPDIKNVARINTDDLIWHFVKEYGINFSKKIRKKDSKTSDSAKNTGIYFPGSIFIYNIASKLPSTFFCTLPVHDLPDLKAYIKNRFDIFLTDSAGINKGSSKDGKIMIACNSSYISIAWSPQRETVWNELVEILSEKNKLSQKDFLISALKKEKSVFAASNGVYSFTMDLKSKQLLLNASFKGLSKMNIPASPEQRNRNRSANASFYLNTLPDPSLFKPRYEVKQYNIETDSLLQYYGGYVDVEIGSPVSQADTVTTYEYDDNFEKKEKQTVTLVTVPSIQLSLLAKPAMLLYLQKQGLVSAEMKLNKEIFPLYNVAVSQTSTMLYFSTAAKNIANKENFAKADNFLALETDVQKTMEALNLTYLQPYIKNIRQVKITGRQKGALTSIAGNIDFEHAAIRDLIDIIKAL